MTDDQKADRDMLAAHIAEENNGSEDRMTEAQREYVNFNDKMFETEKGSRHTQIHCYKLAFAIGYGVSIWSSGALRKAYRRKWKFVDRDKAVAKFDALVARRKAGPTGGQDEEQR